MKKELDFTDKSTKVFPLPQKYSERIYVPAPSGSGKSTFIGEYLKQLRILYPQRRIVIFSRVEKDEPLDRFKNLERVNLRGANLYKTNLEVSNLKWTDLRGANLTRADLRDTDLMGADLSEAKLIGANLYRVNLIGANLKGANLFNAILDNNK